jgi:hypothetical protein
MEGKAEDEVGKEMLLRLLEIGQISKTKCLRKLVQTAWIIGHYLEQGGSFYLSLQRMPNAHVKFIAKTIGSSERRVREYIRVLKKIIEVVPDLGVYLIQQAGRPPIRSFHLRYLIGLGFEDIDSASEGYREWVNLYNENPEKVKKLYPELFDYLKRQEMIWNLENTLRKMTERQAPSDSKDKSAKALNSNPA